MRILVLTDSLGLPRDKPERTLFHETWPQLLANDFIIHQCSLGGGTIDEISRQVEYQKHFNPDIVILQAGIVDCAPRALKKLEIQLLSRLGYLGKKMLKIIKNKSSFLRRVRNITYTKERQFENYLIKLKKRDFSHIEVYGLSIIDASDIYKEKIPGIQNKIDIYNNILMKTFGKHYVSLSSIPVEGIMSDGHHLNEIGHNFIYETILKQIPCLKS